MYASKQNWKSGPDQNLNQAREVPRAIQHKQQTETKRQGNLDPLQFPIRGAVLAQNHAKSRNIATASQEIAARKMQKRKEEKQLRQELKEGTIERQFLQASASMLEAKLASFWGGFGGQHGAKLAPKSIKTFNSFGPT